MAIIKKKLWKEYYDAVASGKKKAEFRLNDFDVEEGDTLLLEEWDRETSSYTGRVIEKKVTCVTKLPMNQLEQFWSKEEIQEKGFQMISME